MSRLHRSSPALVLALGLGTATLGAQVLELSDIVAGGNGTGTAPAGNIGVDPRDGSFATAGVDGTVRETDPNGDGINPSPVGASEFIDSVFLIGPTETPDEVVWPQGITQSGVTFDFPTADAIGTGWNVIAKNANGGVSGPPITIGGLTTLPTAIGIHASAGVTFSLDALRAAHGAANVGCFSTFWGMDACGGDVILYAILSNDEGVLSAETFNATQNSGVLLQVSLPAEAKYLTLATGSNGADGCDHGSFGIPRITPGACVPPAVTSLRVRPASTSLGPDDSFQLAVTGFDADGLPRDLAPAATGTTYAVVPDGIVSVSADGLVTGLALGQATVTATNNGLSGSSAVFVQDFIDLGNIVAGGDGKTPPPEGNIGINADTGAFVQARLGTDVADTNGINPQPVDGTEGSSDSPYIDSVFILNTGLAQPINSLGVTFDFEAGEAANGWEAILNGREPGGPDNLSFGTIGPFTSGVGCHAAQGVTFDLNALRSTYGNEKVKFISAVAGDAGSAGGKVSCFIILSSEDAVLGSASVVRITDNAQFLQLEIPPEAAFATLAVGAGGDGIGSDHGQFANARIRSTAVDTTTLSELVMVPLNIKLDVGRQTQLRLTGTLAALELGGIRVPVPPENATFLSLNPAIASVGADGKVIGVAPGKTKVRATVGAVSAEVNVTIGSLIDLGDIAAGGDGSGNAPAGNIGIDPRDGSFATAGVDGTIRETDANGDGVNPSPALDSTYIDSVFFVGPTDDPAAPTYPQGITQSGVTFDFPTADAIGTGWNVIAKNANGGLSGPPITVGGLDTFTSALGIHASMGITYDLAAIRAKHGVAKVKSFSAFWGMDGCTGDVMLYAILANNEGVLDTKTFNATQNSGELVAFNIPESALYLTLATGSNGADGCDHGTFAEAYIQESVLEPDAPSFHRGDADNNGELQLTDAVRILGFLFLGGAAPTCLDAADADDNGQLQLTDAVRILGYLFLGQAPPAPPGPPGESCGIDPVLEEPDLGCVEYTSC